jgi:multicomponent Na+:H+ antiporter subunit B
LSGLFTEAEVSSIMIPILNILITIKVAIGAWAIMLAFIRYRGLF